MAGEDPVAARPFLFFGLAVGVAGVGRRVVWVACRVFWVVGRVFCSGGGAFCSACRAGSSVDAPWWGVSRCGSSGVV